MIRSIRLAAAAALAVALAQPVAAQETPADSPANADTVVATVGGTDITLGEMIVLVSQLPQQYRQMPDQPLFGAVLDQLVSQTAIAQTVEGDLSKEARIALENQRRAFLAGEALDRLAAERVTEDDIKAAYDAQYAAAGGQTEYNAQHILVETEDEAKAIRDELDGGTDFAALAREKSTGPSGASGGDLGWFTADAMIAPFADAVAALIPGEISEPVETQFGWHVIRLNETREKSAPALADVRADIAAQLRQEEVQTIIEEITGKAEITRSDSAIDPSLIRNTDLLTE